MLCKKEQEGIEKCTRQCGKCRILKMNLETVEDVSVLLRELKYNIAYSGELSNIKQFSCVPIFEITKVIGLLEYQKKKLLTQ